MQLVTPVRLICQLCQHGLLLADGNAVLHLIHLRRASGNAGPPSEQFAGSHPVLGLPVHKFSCSLVRKLAMLACQASCHHMEGHVRGSGCA